MKVRVTLARCGLIAATLFGCSEAQPTVNRVQPNAVDKAVFEGSEWYYAATVIDTPYSGAAFVGAGASLDKVAWDVEKEYLIARSARSHVDDSEGQSVSGEGASTAGVVAIYPIVKHFDIRRAYNTVTGEEQNVVVENDTDRPWYERRYMRVDWSQNLAAGDLTLALTGGLGSVEVEPVAWYVEDPDHPFAPKFERDETSDEVYYMDIVNKFLLSPQTTEYRGVGRIPACMLTFNAHLDCSPGEVAIRNSFLRVDPERDYQPMEYTSDRMSRAGFFLTTRDSYDRDYGVLASKRLRLVNRHNLWQRSHVRDDEGALVGCSDDEECGGGGAICDHVLARAKQLDEGACTLPYREREVRPVVYYLSRDFPEDLVADARHVAEEFNGAFRDTVSSLRQLECEAEGGEECEAERDRADAEHTFVLCENPVSEDDHEACGAPGLEVEIGDLRYSMMVWVSDPHTSSPLGYGPSFPDPDTGEIIAGSAYLYGAATDVATAMARDLLALLNGDLDEAELTENDAFAAWVDDIKSGREFRAMEREAQRHAVGIDGADAERIASAMSFEWQEALLGIDDQAPPVPDAQHLVERLLDASQRVLDGGEALRLDRGFSKLEALRGTEIEHLMVPTEMRVAAGLDPLADFDTGTLEAASPLRGMSLSALGAIDRARRELGSHQNTCLLTADFTDETLLGLVKEIQREVQEGDGVMQWYGIEHRIVDDGGALDYERLKRMLRHPLFHATMAHEVGHTLGLRHNFAGSYDSLNYHPRYWELRDDGEMRGRAWDPMSEAEIDGRIREYQFSSVMDYGINMHATQSHGIGKYDRAALKMGYGDLVEVFEEVPADNVPVIGFAGVLQSLGGLLGPLDLRGLSGPIPSLRAIPYTEFPGLVGGLESLERRRDVSYASLQADPELERAFESLLGSSSVSFGATARTVDGEGRAAVPYRYCGDEFADFQPTCFRYDSGADPYETMTSVVDNYWNYYIFNNFMRQRVGFSPLNHASRIYGRYFSKISSANLYYSYVRGVSGLLGSGGDFYSAEDGFGPYTLGIGAGYGLLTRVLGAPAPGSYTLASSLEGDDVYSEGTDLLSQLLGGAGGVQIDAFEGRDLYSSYDFGPDQSFWFMTSTGYFVDKSLALQSLLDPGREVVLGTDLVSGDLRRYQVNFYTTFREPLHEVLRGVAGVDWRTYAPRWMGDRLEYPDAAEQRAFEEMGGTPLDPNVEFTLQLYSMVYSMALTPRTFDQSYVDRARLFVRGGAEGAELELGEERAMVEFVDEDSGLVYTAASFPDVDGHETGIAAQMLARAQRLKDAGAAEALASWLDNLDALRMLTYLYGFGGDPAGFAAPSEPAQSGL